MTRQRTGSEGEDRGAVLVEFALVLPVLACLLLGMFTGGLALFEKINITDATREGARYAATLPVADLDTTANPICDESSTDSDCTLWTSAAEDRVVEVAGGDLTAAGVCVALVRIGSTPNVTCGVDDPAGAAVDDYVVKVASTGSADLNAFFFTRTLTITAEVTARYEREDV